MRARYQMGHRIGYRTGYLMGAAGDTAMVDATAVRGAGGHARAC